LWTPDPIFVIDGALVRSPAWIALQSHIQVDTIVITLACEEVSGMLELKVRKVGNSLGVVLPKEAVSRLHVDEGDRLFLIEGPNGVYQLTPYDPAFERKMKKVGNIIDRYRNTLHSLAK
jgi:putative addiction module antidote